MTIEPEKIDLLFNRPQADAEQHAARRRERALADARASVEANDRDPQTYISAARACKKVRRLEEALDILRQGIARCAPSAPLYEYYVERLEKCNRTEEAIATAREAIALFPDEWVFRLREALALPIFYDSRAQIDACRRRFADNLRRLIAALSLDSPADRHRALDAISHSSNKYLPYQGVDYRNPSDRHLQSTYGSWVQRIMVANFPQFAEPDLMPSMHGKLRIGFLSAFSERFHQLSAGKLFGGWLREMDRSRFELFAYHADHLADPSTEFVLRWNVPFRQLSGDFSEMAGKIRADRLHALICLDFGIHPRMAQLAALRLAPVQCVSWDSPLTSGIPAMDYFLSSELMEPLDVSGQYSEELVRLPGVGVCFAKPVIPTVLLPRRRADFGLREDAVVYLCCQSIFKYSPEQDDVVARIAQRLPNSQFVFLITNSVVGADFRRRLKRSFAALGLDAEKHCLWLTEMGVLDYWNLHRLGDISLDTIGWSGGVSTFEAVACGLPVVTLPGSMMRARHSAAILTQLGVTDTIARDPADYVEIAVRLGQDRRARRAVVDRTITGYPNLFSDTRSVRALEHFLHRAVRDHLHA